MSSSYACAKAPRTAAQMAFQVTFDELAKTVRIKQSGPDCDVVDAMNAFESMRMDTRYPAIAKLLIDLSECHADRTHVEVEAVAEFLRALYHGHVLAFVTSAELAPHLEYAKFIFGRDGSLDTRVFATAAEAENWLRAVN